MFIRNNDYIYTHTCIYTHCLSRYIVGIYTLCGNAHCSRGLYTWSEMIYELVIIVPLKGANPSKAEVMIMIM